MLPTWLLVLFSLFVVYKLYLLATRKRPRQQPYSAPTSEAVCEGSTQPTRSFRSLGKPLPATLPGATTLYEVLEYAVSKFGPTNFCGTRPLIHTHTETIATDDRGAVRQLIRKELGPYKWQTYSEFFETVADYASGLDTIIKGPAVSPGSCDGAKLALYDETRIEWTIAEHACFRQNIIVVTVYSNLGEDALVRAINEGPIETLQTNGGNLKILASLIKEMPSLKQIIYADQADEAAVQTLLSHNIKLYTTDQILQRGREHRIPPNPPVAESVAVIMYTSGSTGRPKGVIITHANMVGALAGVLQLVDLQADDVYLNFLPLAHVLALVVENGLIYSGATIGYGSPRTMIDIQVKNCRGDLSELRPTLMAGVPAIYDRIKSNATSTLSKASPIVRWLWKQAFAAKRAAIAKGERTPIWDLLVFNKARSTLGGRLRFALTGGAALSPEAHEWLRVVLGCPVLQGYGLTETCGAGTLQEIDDLSCGVTGPPVPSVEIKLVDVPEMNYLSSNSPPQGEIWIRGPSITRGYYKNEETTQEAYQPEGWFTTGDVGQFMPNGCLKIIDRKKNLIKPPHGEYVAIERLESEYKNCPLVANLMVYVDSHHNSCLAFISPDHAALKSWAQRNEFPDPTDLPAVCRDKRLIDFFIKSLMNVARQNNLKNHEHIKGVYIDPEDWTPENNLLTAAMKLNRQAVVSRFRPQIEELYKIHP